MNKRCVFSLKKNSVYIGGVSINSLVKKYGTPLYVYDEKFIEDNCKAFTTALNDNYKYGTIAYASKAFCCKEMYKVIKKFDMSIDVVSIGELYTAISSGFDVKKVYFHGNNKTDEELLFAIENNVGYIVIDSYSEIDRIEKFAKKLKKIQNVLVRVNPGIEAHTHEFIKTAKTDSKFGFSISSGDALQIVKYVISKKRVHLSGIHCHIGSQIFDKKSFVLASEKMINFYREILENQKYKLDIVDLGGGFGIWYSDTDKEFDLDDYTSFITTIVDKVKFLCKTFNIDRPYLVFEPGRAIVGEAGTTLYTAGPIKEITNVRTYLPVDGGMGDNPRYALYQAKYTVLNLNKFLKRNTTKYTVCGKYCESGDIIAKDIMMPKTEEGDIIAVLSTGAYNYSMASNYNRNAVPPVVFVKDGNSRYVVKKQTLDDIIRNDI